MRSNTGAGDDDECKASAAGGARAAVLSGALRAQAPETVTLAVPGRANATPWIAAHGRFVAVVWAAAAGSASDIFVATSRDEGATFGAPVQVNRVAGDGRVSGEIPPRVALHARAGASEPDVVVAWNAKDQGTEIKVARSVDGGATLRRAGVAAVGGRRRRPRLALAGARRRGHGARGVARPSRSRRRPRGNGRASGGEAGAHQHKGEHDGVAMAQGSALRYATFGGARLHRSRAHRRCLLLLQVGHRGARLAAGSCRPGVTSTPTTCAISRSPSRATAVARSRRRPG